MPTEKTKWLRRHAAGERELSHVLLRYFAQQRSRIMAVAADLDTIDVGQIFDRQAEHASLVAAVAAPMLGFMFTGAEDGMSSRKLPRDVRDSLQLDFQVISEQPYWLSIQDTTIALVAGMVSAAAQEQVTKDAARRQLGRKLKDLGKLRAPGIARTETTLAYNAGRDAGFRHLPRAGRRPQRKEWLAIIDNVTRNTHLDADGQVVDVDEDFEVGGEFAPYPGWWGLSIGERANCRCASVLLKERK